MGCGEKESIWSYHAKQSGFDGVPQPKTDVKKVKGDDDEGGVLSSQDKDVGLKLVGNSGNGNLG